MTRFIMTLAIVLAAAAPASVAFADPAPTQQQMEQAKAAYVDGKALHDQGKLAEAIEKFKESYRLSKRPQLLYNIALTMEEAKQDLALFYYNKYLKDAPANDPNRALATERVKVLEAAALNGPAAGTGSGAATPNPPTPTGGSASTGEPPPDTMPKPPVEPPAPVKIKPAGTYKAEDFQHQIVEEAPPGKPLDVSASVPQDSGWTVMLYFRVAGEPKFNAKPMKWRYKELVARIPGAKMTGSAIQYYLEVKDQTGEVVTRAGKSTSPNLVNLDEKVAPRFYPDLNDDSGPATVVVTEQKHGDDDDPLHKGPASGGHTDEPIGPITEPGPADGFRDVGSKKFERTKWIATGATVALFAASAYFFVEAGKQASALQADISTDASGHPCAAPCRPFDSFDADLQSAGKRDQTLANVTFVVGVAGVAVAGYFWYRELKGHHASEQAPGTTSTNGAPEASLPRFMIAPTTGEGFTGAAAIGRF